MKEFNIFSVPGGGSSEQGVVMTDNRGLLLISRVTDALSRDVTALVSGL